MQNQRDSMFDLQKEMHEIVNDVFSTDASTRLEKRLRKVTMGIIIYLFRTFQNTLKQLFSYGWMIIQDTSIQFQ